MDCQELLNRIYDAELWKEGLQGACEEDVIGLLEGSLTFGQAGMMHVVGHGALSERVVEWISTHGDWGTLATLATRCQREGLPTGKLYERTLRECAQLSTVRPEGRRWEEMAILAGMVMDGDRWSEWESEAAKARLYLRQGPGWTQPVLEIAVCNLDPEGANVLVTWLREEVSGSLESEMLLTVVREGRVGLVACLLEAGRLDILWPWIHEQWSEVVQWPNFETVVGLINREQWQTLTRGELARAMARASVGARQIIFGQIKHCCA